MRKRAQRLLPILVLAVVVGGVWYVWGRGRSPAGSPVNDAVIKPPPPPVSYETKPALGSLAPNFLLKTVDGREVRLSDRLGQPVVVNFWSSRCPFCLTELRNFTTLVAEARGRVAVLAVNRGEIPGVVANFLDLYVRPSDVTFLLDPDDRTYGRYEGFSLPQSFFVDRGGVIRDIQRGELSLAEMRQKVRALSELP